MIDYSGVSQLGVKQKKKKKNLRAERNVLGECAKMVVEERHLTTSRAVAAAVTQYLCLAPTSKQEKKEEAMMCCDDDGSLNPHLAHMLSRDLM